MDITVYQFRPRATVSAICSREYQNREKCNLVNLIQSCKSGRLKKSLGFHEIFIRVDLIHGFKV